MDNIFTELEKKITDTVNSYMSKVKKPYAILLSGGLDSGLLAALTNPSFVYSVEFAEDKYSERDYRNDIIKYLDLGSKANYFLITKESFERNFEDAVKVMGEIVPHFSLVPLYILMKNLNKLGIKDVLSGEGPDEYLGGYARQIIFDELLKLYSIPELENYEPTIRKVIGDDLIKSYGKIIGYDSFDVIKYSNLYRENQYPLQGVIGKMDMELGVIEKMEQKLANHFGITLHYPYINDDFAEYCYHLPDNLKIRGGITKWAFRQICSNYLPSSVINRKKMGGPVAPVGLWLNSNGNEFDKTEYIKRQKEILGL